MLDQYAAQRIEMRKQGWQDLYPVVDPEMQQLANSIGVSEDDLLLFREMMLDRYAHRSQDPE